MPDRFGKLSPAEMDFGVNWLKKHLAGRQLVCPVCQDSHWTLSNSVGLAPAHMVPRTQGVMHILSSGKPSGGQLSVMPHIYFHCDTCGFSVSFGAIQVGLYRPDENIDG